MFFTKDKANKSRLESYLRRICDLTSPNLPRQDEFRGSDRQNRTIPVLVSPLENGVPVVEETTTALTKDVSNRGLSVTMPHPFRCDEAVVGFWLPRVQDHSPWFFRSIVRPNIPIGGSFWALGLEAVEVLTIEPQTEFGRLLPLIKELIPPKRIETTPLSALLKS